MEFRVGDIVKLEFSNLYKIAKVNDLDYLLEELYNPDHYFTLPKAHKINRVKIKDVFGKLFSRSLLSGGYGSGHCDVTDHKFDYNGVMITAQYLDYLNIIHYYIMVQRRDHPVNHSVRGDNGRMIKYVDELQHAYEYLYKKPMDLSDVLRNSKTNTPYPIRSVVNWENGERNLREELLSYDLEGGSINVMLEWLKTIPLKDGYELDYDKLRVDD